jgi:uncharacterized protein (TIGR00661 family)
MRFFFIVQGEGRGHMTQSMALANMLRARGHEVSRVVVGKSRRREIPSFFKEGIGCRIDQVHSPNFVTDKKSKSVRIWKSVWHGMARLNTYRKSLVKLDEMVKEDDPDVIINFYDFIGGLYNLLKKPNVKFVCIAHQYLAKHSVFEYPKGRLLDKRSMKMGNWVTSLGADARLALSFHEDPDEGGITVVPPLLRTKVRSAVVSNGDYLLVYMLNHGYADEIDHFHAHNPDISLHCFWDKPDTPDELKIDDQLTYHQLNGTKFLDFMAGCKGYLTTAGFESVCEAMYLGKPAMMMPVQGHYEQACNALDAVKAGAGISSAQFDLQLLVEYLPKHKDRGDVFRNWCDRAEGIFLDKLESVGNSVA